jgi:hypothetical protein
LSQREGFLRRGTRAIYEIDREAHEMRVQAIANRRQALRALFV